MKYFIDTEFVEDGSTIDLISIGVVCEDGREYYAISAEFDRQKAEDHPFVGKVVLPALLPCMNTDVKYRSQIESELIHFVGEDTPEFWADYGAYDWVAFCQIFGAMMDLPKGWPMFCRDVQQLRDWIPFDSDEIDNPKPHHALSDARECRDRYLLMENHSRVEVSLYRRQ